MRAGGLATPVQRYFRWAADPDLKCSQTETGSLRFRPRLAALAGISSRPRIAEHLVPRPKMAFIASTWVVTGQTSWSNWHFLIA